MIIEAPTGQALQTLLGEHQYALSEKLIAAIESRYSLDRVWHSAGKQWTYELKFRKGGKTPAVVSAYDAAKAYHDGKWLLFDAQEALFADFMKLLLIKRKPDIKQGN